MCSIIIIFFNNMLSNATHYSNENHVQIKQHRPNSERKKTGIDNSSAYEYQYIQYISMIDSCINIIVPGHIPVILFYCSLASKCLQ